MGDMKVGGSGNAGQVLESLNDMYSRVIRAAGNLSENQVRAFAASVQDSNAKIQQMNDNYSTLSSYATETDATKKAALLSKVQSITDVLKSTYGFSYTWDKTTTSFTNDQISTMQADLNKLKDNFSEISQQSYSNLQLANDQLQKLRALEANVGKSLYDSTSDVIRHYSIQ